MRLKLLACAAALAVAAATAPAANATDYHVTYSGTLFPDSLGNIGPLPDTSLDLTITTGPALGTNVYLITGVSGTVNGTDAVTGLAPLANAAPYAPTPPFFSSCRNNCLVDDAFWSSWVNPGFLDFAGLAFETANNIYALDYNNQPGKGFWELSAVSINDPLNPNPLIAANIPADFTYSRGVIGIPEPGTWALMIAGVGLIGVALRRRRAEAAADGLSLA
jgi:hypothetical protein